jgi:glycosyltransferase involved in cell wall biosynthesis
VSSPLRLAWLHDVPKPSEMEFFHALGESPGVELRVFNCCATFPTQSFDVGAPWLEADRYSFDYRVLGGWNARIGRYREFFINPEILARIRTAPRDEIWIVGGYTIPTVQMAMWALAASRRPWVLVTEPPKVRDQRRDAVRDLLLAPVRTSALGLISYGSTARSRYFNRILPGHRIAVVPQYQNLGPLLRLPREGPYDAERELTFFYAGQVEPYSGVDTVVQAFNEVARSEPGVRLEVLGSGSCLASVEALVAPHARERVCFRGALPRGEVPAAFGRGDILVHANLGQGWGMVVNEAFAAGMPVIASREIGAAEELVQDDQNGYLLDDPKDVGAFAAAMTRIARQRAELPRLIAGARATAARLDLSAGVREFVDILTRFARA